MSLQFLRNFSSAELPEGWNPGWKVEATGTATIKTADGLLETGQLTGDIVELKLTSLALQSNFGRLEYGLNPKANYDQWAFREGKEVGKPSGAMLVLLTRNALSHIFVGVIREPRPLTSKDGSPVVMITPPGGFNDMGESGKDVARRELLEETGIQVDTIQSVAFENWNRAFQVSVDGGNLTQVFMAIVDQSKLTTEDGKTTFSQPETIPDDLKKAKTFQVEFLPWRETIKGNLDALAKAAIIDAVLAYEELLTNKQ